MDNLITSLIDPLCAGFVVIARLKLGPEAPEADLAAEVEGDLKHALRQKLSFAVDFLWAYPQFKSDLDGAITAAIEESKPPAAPLIPAPNKTPGLVDLTGQFTVHEGGTLTHEGGTLTHEGGTLTETQGASAEGVALPFGQGQAVNL